MTALEKQGAAAKKAARLVTEEELEEYYNNHPDEFAGIGRDQTDVNVRHILIALNTDADAPAAVAEELDENTSAVPPNREESRRTTSAQAICVVGATTHLKRTSAKSVLGGGRGSPVAKSVPGDTTSENVTSATIR